MNWLSLAFVMEKINHFQFDLIICIACVVVFFFFFFLQKVT
jgi:hypothetical protein